MKMTDRMKEIRKEITEISKDIYENQSKHSHGWYVEQLNRQDELRTEFEKLGEQVKKNA